MLNLNRQTEYWNSVAWEKTFKLPLNSDAFCRLVAPDARILDYGCGYGRLCAELRDIGYRNIIGVDISEEMLRRAKSEHPEIEFGLLQDVRLPYDDGAFDAVTLFAVLTCVPTDDGQRRIIDEIHRLLRPGGLIYITDYYLQENEPYPQRYSEFTDEFGTYGVFRLPEGGVYRHHDPVWIDKLTRPFELVEKAEFEAMTMNLHLAKVFRYLGRKTTPL